MRFIILLLRALYEFGITAGMFYCMAMALGAHVYMLPQSEEALYYAVTVGFYAIGIKRLPSGLMTHIYTWRDIRQLWTRRFIHGDHVSLCEHRTCQVMSIAGDTLRLMSVDNYDQCVCTDIPITRVGITLVKSWRDILKEEIINEGT